MLAQRIMRVSLTGNYDEISVPMIDGVESDEVLDTTQMQNGWHEAELDELGVVTSTRLAVLNDTQVRVHGGRLVADEVWDDTVLHLVRNNVVVPSGLTLRITEGAIVKFCTEASLRTEAGGKIEVIGTAEKRVAFMHVTNDVLGGDTDMEEGTTGMTCIRW